MFLAAIAVITTAVPAEATVVRVPPLAQMAQRSDVIFEGTVQAQEVVEEGGRVLTLTTFLINDGIKGVKTAEQVVVSQVGGEGKQHRAWIAGAHRFSVGERLVFFGVRLQKNPQRVIPYGIGFGLFREQPDGVAEITGDVANAVQGPDGTTSFSPVAPKRFVSMAAFKAEIAAALERPLEPAGRIKSPTTPASTTAP
jgi:hypothetical protein